MRLPAMVYSDEPMRTQQVQFRGYNHTYAAGEGEIYDMGNLSGLEYPLLSTRPKRRLYAMLTKPNGLFGKEKLCWVDGTTFYYDGVSKGTVANSRKTFAAIGPYIIILPDKKYYNTVTADFGDLESTWSGAVTFQDGTLYGEAAEANTIYASGVTWSNYFQVGDAVTISGCAATDNNKTPIIREIDGSYLRFYENTFENGSESSVTLKRAVPDMDHICECNNRLWGFKGDTIYASKLGDPFNWNVFDGLDTDSCAVDTSSAGDFSGACSYLGYPIGFKPENVYKVYGSFPRNFEVIPSARLGVAEGSGRSLAVAGEVLFYLSRSGPVAYSGGVPADIGTVFGQPFKDGVGGSDGLRYYLSMKDGSNAWHLFVYDTRTGLWYREDSTQVLDFAFTDNLYYLAADGKIWITGNILSPPESEEEEDFNWYAEFGDFTDGSPNKKYVSKLQLRLELDTGASVTVYIQYDSGTTWETVSTVTATNKRSVYIPIIPRRADHYRLKLSGTGGCKVYSLAKEFTAGSEL